jgi:putative hydrolase of the HAD superfamily
MDRTPRSAAPLPLEPVLSYPPAQKATSPMTDQTDIPGLFVDLDGTLVDYDTAVRDAIAEFVATHDLWRHIEATSLCNAWLASRRALALDGSRPLDQQRADRLATIARQFGVTCDRTTAHTWTQKITDAAIAHCQRYPDVDDFLEQAGRLGLITNGDSSFQQAKLVTAGIDPGQFDPFVASMDAGAAKPSPDIYVAAARARRLPPSRCAMIGDSETADVTGALAAGYTRAILIDRSANPKPGSVNSLAAALRIL